jgi:NAD(P)-dependent dehydrogenase (short-subunit alcohol dehydrogenase family)
MDLGLEGRAALVTGGNRGIGYAVAERLIHEGANVAICGRNWEEGKRAAEELGPQAVWYTADVTDDASVRELVNGVVGRFGRLDVLVNNAGRFTGGPLHEIEDERWANGMNTKVIGAIRTSRHARRALVESDQGRIVNISGITAVRVTPNVAITALTNSAMITLTSYLAQDLRPHGVCVNCLVPGYTLTEVWRERIDLFAEERDLAHDEAMAAIIAEQGMGDARWGEPEEVASVVTFLASGPASYVSGATLRVDGAQLPVTTHG